MADKEKKEDLSNLLNKASRELHKQKADRGIEYGVHHPNYYSSLKTRLDSIIDEQKRELLKKMAQLIHQMGGSGYETGNAAPFIELYRDISYSVNGYLIPSIRKRFERIVLKEVKHVRMQEPDNSDLWEICNIAEGAAANIRPLQDESELGKEEVLLNEYLMEILDYRLASLPDEAAWDFVAQSILSDSKNLG